MPLTPKGTKIKNAMQEQYGKEKGESVFYASKNKGTISGVDSSIPGSGISTVAKAKDADVLTGPYPAPERHKDLLGEVSEPETTPRGPLAEAKAPERTRESKDAKAKGKDQSSQTLNVQSGAPMNNLGMGIPAPAISSTPGATKSSTTSPTVSTGDSLRSMNAANRAFWARKR
jgi:hypothetical protein